MGTTPQGAERPHTGRAAVGISLTASADTEAAVAMIRAEHPDVRVGFRDCYYKIESDDALVFDMEELSERLGRPIDTDGFLVNMSTYYGRMDVSDGLIEIHAHSDIPARST